MPNIVSLFSVNFRDVKGFSSTNKFFGSYDTPDDGATLYTAVKNGFAGISNAVYNGGIGVSVVPSKPTLYGSNLEFSTIEDKAIFTFVDTAGSIHRWQVPAPKDAIFLADGETVDPANGLVVAFVNAITTATAGPSFVCSRAGIEVNFFAAGVRIRRKIRRKITIFTLNPTLSGPDE